MARRIEDIIDIDGIAQPGRAPQVQRAGAIGPRPWLAVHWRCCHVYSRIYRQRNSAQYFGRCPRCGKPARATVGPGGTSARFFEAR